MTAPPRIALWSPFGAPRPDLLQALHDAACPPVATYPQSQLPMRGDALSIDVVLVDVGEQDAAIGRLMHELRFERGWSDPVLVLVPDGGTGSRLLALQAGAEMTMSWPPAGTARPRGATELLARCRSLRRRVERELGMASRLAGVGVDTVRGRLSCRGMDVPVPRCESRVLAYLVARAGSVVPAQAIVYAATYRRSGHRNTVEVYVHRLRKRLAPLGIEILTVRGTGYCLRPMVSGAR